MTLQIAAIGTDGILLASDQQSNTTSSNRQVTTSYLTSKILFDNGRGLAACWSGCEIISFELARRILKSANKDLPKNLPYDLTLPNLAKKVYNGVKKQIQDYTAYGDVLFVDLKDLGKVYSVGARRNSCMAIPSYTWAAAGQDSNAALFFCQQFYQRAPIDELVPLAAHTILTAGQIDPARIKGLEILKCTKGGFELVPKPQLDVAQQRFEELNDLIKTSLFPKPAWRAG